MASKNTISLSDHLFTNESLPLLTCHDDPLLNCSSSWRTSAASPSPTPTVTSVGGDGGPGAVLEAEPDGGQLAVARQLQRVFLAYVAPLEPMLLGLPTNALVLALMPRRAVRVTQRARFFYLLVAAADLIVHASYGLVLNVLMEVRHAV